MENLMRDINEYTEMVKAKYEEDHSITGISLKECVDIITDNAFFQNEIMYQNLELLRNRILKELNLN